jgi:mono/diheme cytochrome c family protein
MARNLHRAPDRLPQEILVDSAARRLLRPWAMTLCVTALGGALLGAAARPEPTPARTPAKAPRTGEEIFRAACAGCHGADGTGALRSTLGFDTPPPDFTDCNFTTRENRVDWEAIVRDGGPVRGFSRHMPAFRDALTPEEITRVVAYVQHFCQSRSWPRGEFNLPRPMVTEKAFPEDEAILTTQVATSGLGSVSSALVLERRLGARFQLEADAPFTFAHQSPGGAWVGGVGDLALGLKYTFFHNLRSGTILSALGEVSLPTGNSARGFGTGTTLFEPFILLGQLLPAQSYFQFQGGVELPTDQDKAPQEAFWSGVLGTTRAFGPITRIISPMVEVVGTRELTAGASAEWDVVPQAQISLSARQHVLANVGVRVPFANTANRHTQIVAYILWDWFDGGLLEGWKGWCPGCRH